MDDLTLLLAARTAILNAMLTGAGKVSYSIGDQSVSWGELFSRLAQVNSQIQALQGPIEQVTEAYSGF